MNFTIPIYVRQHVSETNEPSTYEVRPLFVEKHIVRNEKISHAMNRLTVDIRQSLRFAARHGETDSLLAWSFCPAVEDHRLDIQVKLRRRTAQCRFLIVSFKAMDRKMAFTPSIPDLWFEMRRGESLSDRAATVLSRYYREQENDDAEIKPETCSIRGKAYVTTLEIEINLPHVSGRRQKISIRNFAELFSEEKLSGDVELEKVGDCLDESYPDDLDRAILRDEELKTLTTLLDASDRRPVLLLGPRQSGKTTLIHEYVYRRVEEHRGRVSLNRNTWHLSPQRLISGMSVVGQWENRVLAILHEAKRRDHILYFDDLLGLYLAGVCSSSSLSVAQVLKPHVEAHEFRLLAECTPEAFRVLQERDRGFADLFHVIRVRETTRAETLRIMIAAIRQYEERNRCRFSLDALPAIMELQGRYVHDTAFPGKAASFARRLALKQRNNKVDRLHVFDEFQAISGMAAAFTDGRAKLERSVIEEGIRGNVIGQDVAVQTLTDAICRAKARLNDPERPLGAFLFVGPTGVGKTQCAKAVTTYLFGDDDRLLRFDMNECSDAASAARLVGTFMEPEGLLTSAIRRRPFCVLLLDEIEKAHPDVFDLLLQVLGEGRLTDALGRTADFRNALIILTSNLGATEVRSQLGFQDGERSEDAIYLDAAKKFFRPEFFNRLDRVVPFAPLKRDEITIIADWLLSELILRHGLRQRKCVLQVDESAMNHMVDAGYHPRLGARALKRIIEQQLAQPVATCLAALPPGAPTVINAYAAPTGIATVTQGLVNAEPLPQAAILSQSPDTIVSAVETFLGRAVTAAEALKPKTSMTAGQMLPGHFAYLAVSEQLRHVERLRNRMVEHLDRPKPIGLSSSDSRRMRPRGRRMTLLQDWDSRGAALKELMAAESAEDAIRNLVEQAAVEADPIQEDARVLVGECALLDAILRDPESERVLLSYYASDGRQGRLGKILEQFYESLVSRLHAYQLEDLGAVGNGGWVVSGPGASDLLRNEAGTQMLMIDDQFIVAEINVIPLNALESDAERLRMEAVKRHEWIGNLAAGMAKPEDDPYRRGPVLRMFHGTTSAVDFRTGLVARDWMQGNAALEMVLGALPLPEELCGEGSHD